MTSHLSSKRNHGDFPKELGMKLTEIDIDRFQMWRSTASPGSEGAQRYLRSQRGR